MKILKYIYNAFKKIVGSTGYDFVIVRKNEAKGNYESIYRYLAYAPWLGDVKFKETYKVIGANNMIDVYRSYDLWQLVKETAKLDSGAVLEVGVWRGGTGSIIAKQSKISGIKEVVYLCDTFTGIVKAGEKDSTYVGGEHTETSVEIVVELLKKLNLDNVKILKGMFPEESSHLVMDTTFRFCHIDVDVYQSAKDILEWVWPKMVSGGMVVFDDYGFRSCDGITKLVNEYFERKDRFILYNLNGHAIMIKI